MKKTLVTTTLAALSSIMLFNSITPMTMIQAEEEVIATVGDQTISKEDLYVAMKNVAGSITLRTLILEIILESNVENVDALKTAANEEIKAQIEEAGGEEVFQQLLASQQLGSTEDYEYQIYIRNLFQEVVESNIDMSDEAIQAYYDNQYSAKMEAQHILVDTKEEALAAIERINNGEEFDAVAKELSKDGSAQNGGLLQPFTSGQMVPEFEEAVKSLANGEMTPEPVESQFGFHVIKTINNGEKKPLADIREEVEQDYVSSKFADTEFAYSIIGKLIVDTGYEIKDEDLKDAVQDLVDLATAPPVEETSAESAVESTNSETSAENTEAASESEAASETEASSETEAAE